ncbi:MAG: helix-turn-helix transcriptional regulator [Bryobacterales bacterium]|nr:helix-turn-helix transcriptional regulator [Bryobacterales bacterium]
MPTVGDRIREIREDLALTQEELASRAGLSKGFLSDVENNKRNLSSRNLLGIANAVGTSIDYLLRGHTAEQAITQDPIVIPPELSRAAEELNLTYSQTIDVLEAQRSIIARRSRTQLRKLSVNDWKNLHQAIRDVFG